MAHFYRPNCKCTKGKRCSCGATWTYITENGVNPKTGIRKQKKKGGFRTRAEAVAAEGIFRTEHDKGTYVEEKNTTFKEFSVTWLKRYQAIRKVKISTVRVRQNEINNISPYFECIRMKDVTLKMYQDALDDLKSNGYGVKAIEGEGTQRKMYSDNTLDGIHCTGRMIFQTAVELGVIKTDPTQYAYVPKTHRTVEDIENKKEIPKFLEKEELALFLKTAQEHGLEGDYLIFLTLAYSGIRDGELCCLRKDDFNKVESELSITKTYYNPTNNIIKYTLLPPKTTTSERKIELDPIVFAELDKHLAEQNVVKMRFRNTYYDKGYVFANTSNEYAGYPVYIKFVESRMTRLLKLAGLNQTLTPHSLRHTHVSLLAEIGVPLPDIMDRLGHKDDDTTKNVYHHVTKNKKKEASQKFAELMQSL